MDGLASRFAHRVIAVSHAVERFYVSAKGVPRERIVVIHNGIDLERFDRYRGGAPAIASITLRPLPSLRPAWAGLLRNDVDLVTDVPPGAVEFVANADIRVIRFERRYQYVIAFNSKRGPLGVPAVRRALNLAVDRDALIRSVLQGHGVASSGPVWHRFWAGDNTVGGFRHDPAEAEAVAGASPDLAGEALRRAQKALSSRHPPKSEIDPVDAARKLADALALVS